MLLIKGNIFLLFIYLVLGVKPRASCILSRLSAAHGTPSPPLTTVLRAHFMLWVLLSAFIQVKLPGTTHLKINSLFPQS